MQMPDAFDDADGVCHCAWPSQTLMAGLRDGHVADAGGSILKVSVPRCDGASIQVMVHEAREEFLVIREDQSSMPAAVAGLFAVVSRCSYCKVSRSIG